MENNPQREWSTYLIITLVLTGLLSSLSYNTISSPLMRDEGEYAYSAQLLRNGGVPYKEAFMQKPPMIIYTYYAAQEFSLDVWAPRLLALLSLVLSGLVLFAIVRREYNESAALGVVLLFPSLIYYPLFEAFSAQPEVFLILPLVASWWCYVRSKESSSAWLFIGIGVCSSIAIMYKPLVLPAVAFLTLCVGIRSFTTSGLRYAVRTLSLVALGASVSALIIFSPIIIRGGLSFLIESAFLYNLAYAAVSWLYNVFGITFWLATLPIWVLFLWFVFKIREQKILFVGLFLTLLIGTAGGIMRHYYIISIPALAVIAAVALADIGVRLEKGGGIRKFTAPALFVLVLATLILPTSSHLLDTPKEALYALYNDPRFEVSPAVAREVSLITSPNDTVFIDGNQPEVLYYAGRTSPTRFVILYPLTLKTSYVKKYNEEVVASLEANPPDVIVSFVIPQRIDRFLRTVATSTDAVHYVLQSIRDHYDFVSAVPLYGYASSGVIRSPKDFAWDEQYYVVYKKKS